MANKRKNVTQAKAYRQKANKDDIDKAIYGLDMFTKNFCMDVAKSDKENDLVFRCAECEFRTHKTKCRLKMFAYTHKSDYPLDSFGSMGR